ncbi:MAG TPA: EboA domain-containing protein [Kofleriaceae bacterium]|nr:EboA domain-containing protein [Kofleriaceae bacterium]
MPDDADRALAELLRARVRPDGQAWLDDAVARIAAGAADVAVAFPAAGRQVGRGGLDAPGATLTADGGDPVSLAAWRIDDAARVRLLLADARRAPAGALARALALYHQGDARERTGALRALAFLPGAAADAAALPAVLDAMRVTQGEIFEAAICDNPYAGRHLPQHEWRKAALKAIFNGFALGRLARLDERADAELAASLVDFATEREAATRAVPPELWPVAARFPPPGLAAKLLGYLEHPSPEHRAAAAEALGRLAAADARLRPFLADRADREPVAAIAAALRRALTP